MSKEAFKEILKKRNLRATSQRLDLLLELEKYKSAMPYSAIQKKLDAMDRVTLYRTLETLTEQGVIHKAFQENNEVFYAVCGEKCSNEVHHHDHIHFKCVKCEVVTCENINNSINVSLPEYEIHKISINVSGVCARCLA